jgi:colicin import membrane protein
VNAAATWRDTAEENRSGLIISVIGHLVLLGIISANLTLIPSRPIAQLAIEATLVAPDKVKQAPKEDPRVAEERRREELEREKQAQEQQQREQQAQEEKARQAAEQKRLQEQQAAEQRRADQQRKEAEAKAQAEQQKQREAAEQQARERKAAEEKARLEKERKAAEERAREEALRSEQARRQAELLAAMEAEEALASAASSGELARYLALIQQKVERNWVPPASVQPGLECEVAVQQLPNGDVVDARTVRCNGDAAVQRSIENAVRRSSPLPLPDNRALFERNLRFIFKPEQ